MIHFLLSFCVVTLTTVRGRENVVWSPWSECKPASRCFKRRVLKCRIDGVDLAGVHCGLLDGRQIFEQAAQTGCTDYCITQREWTSPIPYQTCSGDCYDAIRVNLLRCASAINTCRMREFIRCYNEDSCSGTWTRTGSSAECSARCGGGSRVWNEACFDDEGESSYNCEESGGPFLSSTKQREKGNFTRTLVQACNNQLCDEQVGLIVGGCVVVLAIIIAAIALIQKNKLKRINQSEPKSTAPTQVDVELNNNSVRSNRESNESATQNIPTHDYDELHTENVPEQRYSSVTDTRQIEFDEPHDTTGEQVCSSIRHPSISECEKKSTQALYSIPKKGKQKSEISSSHDANQLENDYTYSTPRSTAKLPEVYDKLRKGSAQEKVQSSQTAKTEEKNTEEDNNDYDKLNSQKRASLVPGGGESQNVYNIPSSPPPSINEYNHLQVLPADFIPEDEYGEADRVGYTHMRSFSGSTE